MDEAELTRKAIEEIMREMNAQNDADKLPQVLERKLNPLRRPNKDFLDRTLNSVMTHNKRQLERNRRKCQNKLRDMDEARTDEQCKRRGRETDRRKRNKKLKRRNSQSSTTSSSSSDLSLSKERKYKHKKTKKLKKRSKKRTNSTSGSSSSLSTSALSLDMSNSSTLSSSSKRNRKRQNKHSQEEYAYEQLDPTSIGYYVEPNLAWAVVAYTQMNQLMQQQQLAVQAQLNVSLKTERNINAEGEQDIPSDLSLTYHSSESELNISLNSSSAEEDEHGVLTFKLISDEERTSKKHPTKPLRKRKELVSREDRNNSKQSSATGVTLLDTTSESDDKSELEPPRKMEEITIISSSSNGESDQDMGKRDELITTILSSNSSSEAEEDVENAMKHEGITILSSSSEAEEEEEPEKKDQKDTEIIILNQNKTAESNDNDGKEKENAALCQGKALETNHSEEMADNMKVQEGRHQTQCTGDKDFKFDAKDEKQDADKMDKKTFTLDNVENAVREGVTILSSSSDTEEQEEGDLKATVINTLTQNNVAESNDNFGNERQNVTLYHGNESQPNTSKELNGKGMNQEESHRTLLSKDKDLKSTAQDDKQNGDEVIENEELMHRNSKKIEISESKHDIYFAGQPTSSSKVIINSCLTIYDNEKSDNVCEAKVTAEDTSDTINLDVNKRLRDSIEFIAYDPCVRQADDIQEKEKEIITILERDMDLKDKLNEIGTTAANVGVEPNTSETRLISCGEIHLNNEKEIGLLNQTKSPVTTEKIELETERVLRSNENIELISEIEGKQGPYKLIG